MLKMTIGHTTRRWTGKPFHRVPVLIPPRKFITLFDELLTPIFAQLRNLRHQNQKLHTARDLLLARLMSGEIAV
jgi:type I restriction enzyme S subunit